MDSIPFHNAGGGKRDGGIRYRMKDVDAWIAAGNLDWFLVKRPHTKSPTKEGQFIMSDVENAYREGNERIAAAKEIYDKTLATFRSAIKNDMASVSSSADRVQKETAKMAAAYRHAVDTLTSPGMLIAIENAERLAKAIESISALKEQQIAFSILDRKAPPTTERQG